MGFGFIKFGLADGMGPVINQNSLPVAPECRTFCHFCRHEHGDDGHAADDGPPRNGNAADDGPPRNGNAADDGNAVARYVMTEFDFCALR